nr:MAG TPA: hypothetical protein [Caudoviricetes sp.]
MQNGLPTRVQDNLTNCYCTPKGQACQSVPFWR